MGKFVSQYWFYVAHGIDRVYYLSRYYQIWLQDFAGHRKEFRVLSNEKSDRVGDRIGEGAVSLLRPGFSTGLEHLQSVSFLFLKQPDFCPSNKMCIHAELFCFLQIQR